MSGYDFDLFTIGAGSGGVAGSRRAASYGARVGICESVRVGGTCVLRGCVPKKLLVYGSHFAEEFADAAGYGWHVPPATIDWPVLIARKNAELDRLNGVYIKMLRNAGVEIVEGRGVLIDPHTVEIDGRRVTAKHIMIATGGHATLPDIPGVEHAITSDEALDLPSLPQRMIIVGAGYIGVEFAAIFANLGVEVQLLVRGEELLRHFDADIRLQIAQDLRAKDVELHFRCQPTAIVKGRGGYTVRTADGAEMDAGLVMFATGREPNTRGLGLEAAGVATGTRGEILVDDWSRTSAPHIYAVGDCTDRMNLTPVAIAEGRAIAETLFNDNPTQVNYASVPTAVFSQPPAASVGLSEDDARARGPVDVYRTTFRPMKNTLSGREERTMMKLVVDRATDRVLGCHMVGPDAPEIIQGFAVALTCGATKKQFDMTVGLHPTAAEEFVTLREKVPEREAAE